MTSTQIVLRRCDIKFKKKTTRALPNREKPNVGGHVNKWDRLLVGCLMGRVEDKKNR